ncbi:hypothetical protein DRJ12_04865 [Candidatus Acetothermia bacterium]|nr:MAG: hypothetical protein DRJ12_04865 [Candidatus Acetothermia bacterium]
MSRRGIVAIALLGAIVVGSLALAGAFRRHPQPVPPPRVEAPCVVIAIDPGHGGRDPGGVAGDILEKDINLQIATRLAELISAQPGLKPFLTRSEDITVPNLDRLRAAEAAGAVLYLSVHTNSYSDPGVHGAETLVDDTRAKDDPSWILAEAVQKELVAATRARDRGVQTQALYLRHTKLPAVSVEVGFITAADEGRALLTPEYQEKVARGLLNGILSYLERVNALPPGG